MPNSPNQSPWGGTPDPPSGGAHSEPNPESWCARRQRVFLPSATTESLRPISLIRYMAELGQSSEPSGPSYHHDGLPLEPGLVELITVQTAAPGERHHHLDAFCELGNNWGKPCDVDARPNGR